ncbi:MAG: hypothetical protein H6819_03665 [Phycisphaerales bacterium]|nr:hypothetical protein [Phycisphaerales bacterium]MCB9856295.1 hypothetical protein [Phycisphaerales bacterium]MCB9863266.1 hypothetical protein [Phycisphaerales bacterium]
MMTTTSVHCDPGADDRASRNFDARWLHWLAPFLILIVAIGSTHARGGWPQMWATAFGLYFACKCWVLMVARRNGSRFSALGGAAFVFAWAGMDPKPFAVGASRSNLAASVERISLREGLVKFLTGVALLAISPTIARQLGEYVAMWACVSAYCLILHFGLLHIIGHAWQRANRPVEAIMQRPARSMSLADFWSRRWNRAFRDVSNALVVRPTRRLLGPAGAVGLVFVASGLVHELLMSWPARGGWGLPTAYFTIQGFGIFVERSRLGQRFGLSSKREGISAGWRARIWTAFVVVAPLPLLVHRPFVDNVVIPFFKAIGAM